MPGSRNTTMWEKDRGGRVKVKEVSVGELVGIVIIGQPVGMMPKSWGNAIAGEANTFYMWDMLCTVVGRKLRE